TKSWALIPVILVLAGIGMAYAFGWTGIIGANWAALLPPSESQQAKIREQEAAKLAADKARQEQEELKNAEVTRQRLAKLEEQAKRAAAERERAEAEEARKRATDEAVRAAAEAAKKADEERQRLALLQQPNAPPKNYGAPPPPPNYGGPPTPPSTYSGPPP